MQVSKELNAAGIFLGRSFRDQCSLMFMSTCMQVLYSQDEQKEDAKKQKASAMLKAKRASKQRQGATSGAAVEAESLHSSTDQSAGATRSNSQAALPSDTAATEGCGSATAGASASGGSVSRDAVMSAATSAASTAAQGSTSLPRWMICYLTKGCLCEPDTSVMRITIYSTRCGSTNIDCWLTTVGLRL